MVYSVQQVSAKLQVDPTTVARWIAKGYFPNAYKLDPHSSNSPFRIPHQDLDAFVASRTPAPQASLT